MGDLIAFGERLEERSALGQASLRPAFYFDLGCPFSYLAAERVERLLGEAEWVPSPERRSRRGVPPRPRSEPLRYGCRWCGPSDPRRLCPP